MPQKMVTTFCGSVVATSACNAGDLGSIPGWERSPGEGNGNPLQGTGEPHGPWIVDHGLAGHSPLGHKELDMTE